MEAECEGCERMVEWEDITHLCPACARGAALYDITLRDKKQLERAMSKLRKCVRETTPENCAENLQKMLNIINRVVADVGD